MGQMGKQPTTENDIRQIIDTIRAWYETGVLDQHRKVEELMSKFDAGTYVFQMSKDRVAVVAWGKHYGHAQVELHRLIKTEDMGGCTCSNEPSATSGDSS